MCDVARESAATAKQTPAQRPRANDRGKKDAVNDLSSNGGGSGRAGSKASGTLSAPKARPRGAEKRKHPTLGEKAEILDLLSKKKMKQAAVAEKTGYALRTIQRIVADSKKIETKLKEQPSAANQKSLRGGRNQEVDNMVTEMVEQYSAARLPINRMTIQTFGRKASAALLDAAETDDVRKRHLDFVASDHWAKNFIARKGLQSMRLHGEASGVDYTATIAKGMAEIRKHIEKYDPDDIYNQGETGLCYRLLPKHAYLAPGEGRKTVRGVKGMTAKERISVYVCTNATGTRKMPLTIIGTAANPRCFRTRAPPVKYLSQKRAWSDKRTMIEWWQEFLTFVREVTTKPVLLLMDNHSSSLADLVDPRKQVAVMEYPPNCTSKHQPMYQGVITSWKTHYKTEFLKVRVDTMESAPKLREQARARGMAAGTMGLAEGHQPHILDAAEIACQAWEKISQPTIERCWVKADILPPIMQAEFANTWVKSKSARGKVGGSSLRKDLDDLSRVMADLSLGIKRGHGDDELCGALSALRMKAGEKPSKASIAAARTWILLEDNEEVRTALRLDLQDELMSEGEKEGVGGNKETRGRGAGEVEAWGSGEEDDELSDGRSASGAAAAAAVIPPPPYSDVAESFGALEDAASASAMHDVSFYLRKAKLAWMSARSSSSSSSSSSATNTHARRNVWIS